MPSESGAVSSVSSELALPRAPPIRIPTRVPTVNPTKGPLEGPYPLEVQFNDQSTGSPTEWFWLFGDSRDTTARSPKHVYWTAGHMTVSLTVRNGTGIDTATKPKFIEVRAPSLNQASFRACVDPADPYRWTFESTTEGDWTELEWQVGTRTLTRYSPTTTYKFDASQSGVVHVSLTARYLDLLEDKSEL